MSAGAGGSAAWEGADLLQDKQESRVAWMAIVMPGQKTIACARDSIADTP
jgi:hypothetical protein